MTVPTDNETWIIEAGDAVINKEAAGGSDSLGSWERLVYCLWVADYGMRNAGDLDAAQGVRADFQSEGRRLAEELSLRLTHERFRSRGVRSKKSISFDLMRFAMKSETLNQAQCGDGAFIRNAALCCAIASAADSESFGPNDFLLARKNIFVGKSFRDR